MAILSLLLLPAVSGASVKKEVPLGRIGVPVSVGMLEQDLNQHGIWLASRGKEGVRLEYYGIDLSGMDLSGDDLRTAVFGSYDNIDNGGEARLR